MLRREDLAARWRNEDFAVGEAARKQALSLKTKRKKVRQCLIGVCLTAHPSVLSVGWMRKEERVTQNAGSVLRASATFLNTARVVVLGA